MAPPKSSAAPSGLKRLGLRLLVAAIFIAIWYVTRNQSPDVPRPAPVDPPPAVRVDRPDPPPVAETKKPDPPAVITKKPDPPHQPLAPSTSGKTLVEGTLARNVILRDLDGRTVFRGDVELKPTLDRIANGERLERFDHDGVVFNNRERRLPQKPSGYYHEWVHLTPEIRGPGPQRIISGADGDLWYTPDHYARFFRIRQP